MGIRIPKTTFTKNFNESISIGKIISSVIHMPRMKIDRDSFLRAEFGNNNDVIEKGPVEAGYSRNELKEKATEILSKKISESKLSPDTESAELSESMNLPKEMLHIYSIALQFAQETAYLYGEQDLWKIGKANVSGARKQLTLYCATMLGYTGVSQTARVVATSLKKELKRKVFSKVVYYPAIKTVAKIMGKDVTTDDITEGISEIPAIGDAVSTEITSDSLLTMGTRLIEAFDTACFDCTEEESK